MRHGYVNFIVKHYPDGRRTNKSIIYLHWGTIDDAVGLKNKIAANAKNDPSRGKDAQHGTFISNYTGYMDWGEVADYVESYVFIVDGHLLLEVSALADKIFVSFMQLIKTRKYTDAFGEVLHELGIPFTVEGPYPKNQTKHKLPKQKKAMED